MKKMIFLLTMMLTMVGTMGVCSCNGCKSGASGPKIDDPVVEVYHDYDGVVQDFTAGVSHIQALHRQTMYQTLGIEEYQWRNSRVIFNDKLTLENIDDLHITDVIDVFFYWNEKGPWVQYISTNVKKGTQIPWPINDVWIEDANMSEAPIKLSAEQAIQRLKEWNGILPKDCNFITLRLPVGPKSCNVQWVFGDVFNVLFIDAVTGEVRDSDPAF